MKIMKPGVVRPPMSKKKSGAPKPSAKPMPSARRAKIAALRSSYQTNGVRNG